MTYKAEGTSILKGGVVVARCLTSVSAEHEVTLKDAKILAEKIASAMNPTSSFKKSPRKNK